MSPTGKSYSFRSCVRASEAACARGTMLLPWLGFGRSQRGPASPVPCPSLRRRKTTPLFYVGLRNRCKSLLIDSKSYSEAFRSVWKRLEIVE